MTSNQKSVDVSRARVQQLIDMDAVPKYVVSALLDEIERVENELTEAKRQRNDEQRLRLAAERSRAEPTFTYLQRLRDDIQRLDKGNHDDRMVWTVFAAKRLLAEIDARSADETPTDYTELHRLIHAAWYNAGKLLERDDSPYHWIRDIRDEWVEICAGRRAGSAVKTPTELTKCGPSTPWDCLCGEPSCAYCGSAQSEGTDRE